MACGFAAIAADCSRQYQEPIWPENLEAEQQQPARTQHELLLQCMQGKGLTVHEATLADIGVSTDQEGAGIGVNGRQPAHVLPHLL